MGDADIALRHIARRRPDDLARAFVAGGRSVEALGWIDTQVTKLERRLDRALHLRVDGEPRVLHVEFCLSLRDDVPDRMFEYLGFLFTALRIDAPGEPVPPIESVAVVLSGGRRRLPAMGRRRTAWPRRPFSGVQFRIDAVYQRTIAELRARGSLLWLVFAPLASDASEAAMRDIVAEICARAANYEERTDLISAFFMMAAVDPWRHNLLKEAMMPAKDFEDIEDIWNVPMIEVLRRAPGTKYLIRNLILHEARKEGRREGRQEMETEIAELLGRLFARRIGRPPTTEEERAIVERTRAIGPVKVEDALLDLEGDALVRWLSEPVQR
ncbi:hypothetical protein [Sorangium sp. So ce131]|uniref:hypothetical protein n=1 Tax=Sorangium sp. So ce131 TaxID=3133282 RepID=UPI003F62FEB3